MGYLNNLFIYGIEKFAKEVSGVIDAVICVYLPTDVGEEKQLREVLKKENILDLIENYEPTVIDTNTIEYELVGDNSNKLKIFFDKDSLDFLGWKTTDAYSNEVSFFLKNIKVNITIENKIFKIPQIEDL